MKKNECNIIRDLMPLVLDRVASDESREMVDAHIASCEECREQFEAMKADIPEDTRFEFEEEQKNIVEALRAARAKQKKRRILSVVLPVVISLVVLFGGLMLYGYLYVWESVPVELDLYNVSLARLKDDTIDVTVAEYDMIAHASSSVFEERTEGEDYVMYIYFTAPPVHPTEKKPGTRLKFSIGSFGYDPRLTEIRQGSPKDYITLWKKGETIPAASEEMEAFYEWDNHYTPYPYEPDADTVRIDMDIDEYSRKLDELQAAVPEWH